MSYVVKYRFRGSSSVCIEKVNGPIFLLIFIFYFCTERVCTKRCREETKKIQSGVRIRSMTGTITYTSFSMKLWSTVVIAFPEYFSSVSLSTCAAIIGALFACWASARSLTMSIISCLTSRRVEPSTFGRQVCSFFTTTIGSEILRRKFHLQGGFLVLWQIRKFCTFSNKIYMKSVSNI